MNATEINVLRILRIFGPCSNFDVARRSAGMTADQTYQVVKSLTDRGYAVHPKLQAWDISPKGRRYFAENGLNSVQLFQENIS